MALPARAAFARRRIARRQSGAAIRASSASSVSTPRPGTMTRSVPAAGARAFASAQRSVRTSKGAGRPAARLTRLAVASTSWVMAALDAMRPGSSRTVIRVMA